MRHSPSSLKTWSETEVTYLFSPKAPHWPYLVRVVPEGHWFPLQVDLLDTDAARGFGLLADLDFRSHDGRFLQLHALSLGTSATWRCRSAARCGTGHRDPRGRAGGQLQPKGDGTHVLNHVYDSKKWVRTINGQLHHENDCLCNYAVVLPFLPIICVPNISTADYVSIFKTV